MPSGPKAQPSRHVLRQAEEERLKEIVAEKEFKKAQEAEEDAEWEALEASDKKSKKRIEKNQTKADRETEGARRRFEAQAEYHRELGNVPNPKGGEQKGIGTEETNMINMNTPVLPSSDPSSVSDAVKMSKKADPHSRESERWINNCQAYRPEKKPKKFSRDKIGDGEGMS